MTAQDGIAVRDTPVVVTLDGELDAADNSWATELDAAVDGGLQHIVVDLLNVTFADSSVVRTLIRAHRRTSSEGWVRVVYTQHVIRRVIDICGLADLLPQYTTVEAAMRNSPTRFHPHDSPQPSRLGALDPIPADGPVIETVDPVSPDDATADFDERGPRP